MALAPKIVYELGTENDAEEAVELFLDVYMKDETILQAFGAHPNAEWEQLARDFVQGHLKEKSTFLARDLNSRNRLVGYRGAVIRTPQELREDLARIDPAVYNDPVITPYMELCMEAMSNEDMLVRIGESERVCSFRLLVVRPDYRRHGIATQMVMRSLAAAREQGCDMVELPASGWKAQRLFDKLGFQTAFRKAYASYVDKNGEQRVQPLNGTTHIVGYYMHL